MGVENIVFYDLLDTHQTEIFFSPYGWFVHMALKHKGLAFKHEGLTFLEVNDKIPKLTEKKWDKIPVLEYEIDGVKKVIYNSRDIVNELEALFKDDGMGTLFPKGVHFSQFLESYAINFSIPILNLVFPNERSCLDQENKDFFNLRFKNFVDSIEENNKDEEKLKKHYKDVTTYFKPLVSVLENCKFLEGDKPAYSDYIMFGVMKWFLNLNPEAFQKVVVEDEANLKVRTWFENVSKLHGGYAESFNVYKN